MLGVWAHRQALAARDAGADVRVLVLHRPVPSKAALAARDPKALAAPLRQPLRAELDGIEVRYVPFLAPPRPRTYGSWGAWAAPPLRLALRRLRREFPFDLVHAHYAAPGGDAVRRARPGAPYVVTRPRRRRAVRRPPPPTASGRCGRRSPARGSCSPTRPRSRRPPARLGARATRVVHLGTDLPADRARTAAPRS